MPKPIEAETTTAPETTTVTPADVKPAKAETDWKAEARKWETRAKENSTAAAKLAEIEEAKKTNEQKLEERATAAEKLAADKSLEAARSRIALDKGLTASQAKRLVGSTEEELSADADDLLADLGTKSSAAPRPDYSQGTKQVASSSDPGQVFAQFLAQARR